jgi:thiol-disulfide isomerase/thioredoxin
MPYHLKEHAMQTKGAWRWLVYSGLLVFTAVLVLLWARNGAAASKVKVAPAFTLKTVDGKTVSLAGLKGKVVVLDFWATWCGPCRMTVPLVQKFHTQYAKKGVVVLGVNLRENAEAVKGFVAEQKLTYRQLMDTDGRVANAYGVEGIPTLVVIDKKGNIALTHVGYTKDVDRVVAKTVDPLLKAKK